MKNFALRIAAFLLIAVLMLGMLAGCDVQVAQGPQGEQGIQGEQGVQGERGEDGLTPTITISEDGYWVINGEKTEYKAVATDGANGVDGEDGEDGYDGESGITPQLRVNDLTNMWEVSYDDGATWTSLDIAATGEDGKKGATGADGIGVSNAYIDEFFHLWVELSNGVKIDAGYVGLTYTVTFMDEDGSVIYVETDIEYGASSTYTTKPTKEGYKFLGWFDSLVDGNQFTSTTPVFEDMEVYAQWQQSGVELSCTGTEFYTNSEETIYFYASTTISVDYVYLYDANTNTVICEMFDNGKYSENGDDLQGDGIYSCVLKLTQYEAVTLAYYAESNTGVSSDEVEIFFVLPLTAEEVEDIQSVNATMSQIVADNANASEEEKAVVVQEMLNALSDADQNDGKSYVNGDSIYYDSENSMVSFEYSNGVTGFIMLDGFTFGEDSTAGVSAAQGTTFGSSLSVELNQSFSSNGTIVKTVGDAIVMYSCDNLEAGGWYEVYEMCGDAWTESGLVTDIRVYPTVENYKTALLDCELIVIAEHGGYVTRYNWQSVLDQTSIIFTTEEATLMKNLQYSKDLVSRRLYIATLEDGRNVYCLTPEFFEFYYGGDQLDGSIVYMDNCMGYGQGGEWDFGFADAFVEAAGAEAVYGYHDSVYVAYGVLMMDSIVADLLAGKTAGEAFENAKATYGNNDLEYAQNFQPHWDVSNHQPAIPALSGRADAVLVSNDFLNGSFEMELAGWSTVGDVRIVTKLAEFTPPHGSWMAILTTGIGSSENQYLQGTEGSLLLQSFEVLDHFTGISLSYNVISEEPMEYVGSQYDDQVIIELLNDNGEVVQQLAYESINASTWYSVGGIDFEGGDNTTYCTQWKNVTFEDLDQFVGEKLTLRVRIWDVGDSAYDTAVLIDNIQVW